jgi:hypothetical protein
MSARFALQKTLSATDTPAVPTAAFSKIVKKDLFHTYLMYQPTNGQWVPLEEFDWYWGGTATLANGNWTVTNPVSPPPAQINAASVTVEPNWSDDYKAWVAAKGL